ncbi:hypothetical protein OMP43_08450 [Sphingomonas sp. CBMAI 2297]|uniref:hypothetical protein n=1 Tax=Sphingomonas sp. CBMAI 2297 TaxID=2991720 RepID=UPI0024545982|nr:hypothetical protein [Sphingomonas sp. CBMAI 2297]MDH4744043.1 hypothetical protein [Sphingomonas sp. CBMAI 2297]
MVLNRGALAFRAPFPQEDWHDNGPGGRPEGSGPPPEPSWRARLARLVAWAMVTGAMHLLAMAAMLARRGAISRRQWLHASRFCHRLQQAALGILRRSG